MEEVEEVVHHLYSGGKEKKAEGHSNFFLGTGLGAGKGGQGKGEGTEGCYDT